MHNKNFFLYIIFLSIIIACNNSESDNTFSKEKSSKVEKIKTPAKDEKIKKVRYMEEVVPLGINDVNKIWDYINNPKTSFKEIQPYLDKIIDSIPEYDYFGILSDVIFCKELSLQEKYSDSLENKMKNFDKVTYEAYNKIYKLWIDSLYDRPVKFFGVMQTPLVYYYHFIEGGKLIMRSKIIGTSRDEYTWQQITDDTIEISYPSNLTKKYTIEDKKIIPIEKYRERSITLIE